MIQNDDMVTKYVVHLLNCSDTWNLLEQRCGDLTAGVHSGSRLARRIHMQGHPCWSRTHPPVASSASPSGTNEPEECGRSAGARESAMSYMGKFALKMIESYKQLLQIL